MRINETSKFQGAWKRRNLLLLGAHALVLTIGVVLIVSLFNMNTVWYAWIPVGIGILLWRNSLYSPSEESATVFLHEEHSELEHSLRLLQSDSSDLSLLQALQKTRIQKRLSELNVSLPKVGSFLKDLLLTTVILIAIPFLSSFYTASPQASETRSHAENIDIERKPVLPDSAYIDEIRTTISPPGYTKMRTYSSEDMEHVVPEGSAITWKWRENGPVKAVKFVHENNGKPTLSKNASIKHQVENSSIYYYAVTDKRGRETTSPYYSLKAQEDQKPVASIKGIEEYQRLPWKENHDIDFTIELADDYGLEDAFLSATVAKGSGESVQFREKKFDLNDFRARSTTYSDQFQFSTKDFTMEPGSELYFYIMVKDNCPYRIQATKSTTHFVILEDTVTYEYADDAGMQVDLMPDFFRSQRQIIMDSEKLIKEKSSISDLEFKQRSNELGYDQKMLRLKYGQFLGEEAESGIAIENEIEAEEHDHEHEHEGEQSTEDLLNQYGHNHDHEAEAGELLATKGTEKEDPKNPKWVQELSHSHDSAEENTYFEVSLKTKLKAALSVMWDSELQLRLYEPANSLPYQYEALEYLQEIKNHARVYVHRIGFDPPSIKVAEKRLTGDQDKISTPTLVYEKKLIVDRPFSKEFIAKHSSGSASRQKALSNSEKALLQGVGGELAAVAIEQPGLLPTLTLIRNVLNSSQAVSNATLSEVRRGVLRSMPDVQEEIQSEAHLFHPINAKVKEALGNSK